MEDIDKICDVHDVEPPKDFHKRVKWYAHTAFARHHPEGMMDGFAGNDKAPYQQLMDILNKLDSLTEKITYLEELKGLIPKENRYSAIDNDVMIDINTPKYREFKKFVDKQFTELQEIRYKNSKDTTPQHENTKDGTNKERAKYHSDNFWDTAFDLNFSKDYLNSKSAVYNYMKEDMEDNLGLEMPYKESSFKQIWKKENKKRAGGNNVTDKQ